MARLTRKELKKDELVQEFSRSFEFFQLHREQLGLVIAVIAGLVLAALGGYLLYDKRLSSANNALNTALTNYHAAVKPGQSPAPGIPNQEKFFPSEKEKYSAALKDFQSVAQKHSWLKPGRIARYYVGLCQAELGNYPEAEKELNAAGGRGDAELTALAKFALANLKVREGKPAEAEPILRQFIERPTASVSKPAAQLALAGLLKNTKPAEAQKLYRELGEKYPNSAVGDRAQKGLESLK